MNNKKPFYMVRSIFWVLLLIGNTGCGNSEAPTPSLPEISLEGLEQPVQVHLRSELDNVRAASYSAAANGRLAMVLHTYGMNDAADQVYQRARRFNPEAFEWHYLHGVVLETMLRPKDALLAFDAAMIIDPDYLPLLQRKANLLTSTGDLETAKALYERAIVVQPNLVSALYGLGKISSLNKNPEDAQAYFEKALEIKPNYGDAHFALAEIMRLQGDTERAERHHGLFEKYKRRKAIIEDRHVNAMQALSRTENGLFKTALRHIRQRNPYKAAKAFEQVLENAPENYSVHINLIGLYGDLGEPEKSEQHYQAALALRPENSNLYNNIGVVRLRNDQFEKALESFGKAVSLDPSYATAWKNLGKVQEELGRDALALESFRRSVDLSEDDRQALYFYGRQLVAMGSPATAISPLTKAMDPVDEKTPHYMQVLAAAQAGLGDPGTAIDTLKKARILAKDTGQTGLVIRIDSEIEKFESNVVSAN